MMAWEPVETVEAQDEVIEETQLPSLLGALACTDVSISEWDGRVSIHGISHELRAEAFPALLDQLTLVSIWGGGLGTFKVAARVRAPSDDGEEPGSVIAYGDATMEFHPLKLDGVHLCFLRDVPMPRPGLYTVEVLLDGYVIHAYNVAMAFDRESGDAREAQVDQVEIDGGEETPTGAVQGQEEV